MGVNGFESPQKAVDDWKYLIELQLKLLQNINDLGKASESLARAQTMFSQASGNDQPLELRMINDQIASLTVEVENYQKMLQASGKQNFESIGRALPTTPGWESFAIDSKASQRSQITFSSTSSFIPAWSSNLLSDNESGAISPAAEGAGNHLSTQNTDIKITFKAMKVTIDRPWFNAQVLEKSSDLMNSDIGKISVGNFEDVRKLFTSGSMIDTSGSQLPSWTTAFIVVQDVYITLTSHSTFERDQINDIDSCLSSGCSLLYFRASKSASNDKQGVGYAMKSDNKTISIRILTPQILGWFSQLPGSMLQ
ncbi:hypothetical protein IL306_012339 [Fusarium sp. DS 682]|nr:hypothetical protein IL306_012339 [Fusarium sp. DS 682]